MAYLMSWHERNMVAVAAHHKDGNRQCKFRTVVTEVSFFVDNPVHMHT